MDTYESVHEKLLNEYLKLDKLSSEADKLGDILYSFLENDRIINNKLVPGNFIEALVEVLKRMPDDDYYAIPDNLIFIVETKHITAQNIRLPAYTETSDQKIRNSYDFIVIFCTVLSYPHHALVGLVAHEIAHSFVDGPDYFSDEDAADEQVKNWGFQEELQALNQHKIEQENSLL